MLPRAAAVVLLLAAASSAAAGARRAEHVALPSRCAVRPDSLSYHWPVKPFTAPHPVRGNFGDPRTVFRGRGTFAFHNGVDIVAPDWSSVYPVASGVVVRAGRDEIIVEASDHRTFQYWHLFGLVDRGERVTAQKTVLGLIRPEQHHVHLTEIRDGIVQNPLAPGHLTPYRDAVPPVVGRLLFRDEQGRGLAPRALHGGVSIVAAASDLPSLPVPGPWRGLPVAPAQLSWRLTTPAGEDVVPERVAVDFLDTEPPDREFWDVYVRGTQQNFPVIGSRYMFGDPGKYLFDLTPEPVDTNGLPPGDYVVTVTATDVCGNTGSLAETVRVLPHPEPAVPELPPPSRGGTLSSWPPGRSAYTVILASVPERVGNGGAARIAARHALASGLPEVGVLRSRRFAGLRAGYYVVFSGVYPTYAYAEAAAARAARFYPGALPRRISRSAALARWPLDLSAYTIVLRSLPVRVGLDAARDEAAREREAGLRRVGVLVSSHFGSLQPGYYVIFTGVYRSPDQAKTALARIAARAPGAYLRDVRP